MPDKPKVLIVDDKPYICDSLKAFLSTQGYEIETTGNGHDAMVCLTENVFDLVLLDVAMEEMDGFQVMEGIAHQNLDIIVIIMTGYASTESAVEAFRKGAYDYLRKPFEPEELLTSVKNALNQRMLKKKLRESEQRYRRLAENAKDTIYRMSLPDGHYEYVSPASIALFGYTPEEFYESPFLIRKVIHPDWKDYFEAQWVNLVTGNIPPFYEYQIIHKLGKEKWLNQRNVLICNDKGQPKAIEGIITDITERKQMEEVLRDSETRLQALSEAPFEAIFFSEKGICLDQNQAAERIFGYTCAEAVGRHGAEWIVPEEREQVKNNMLSRYVKPYEVTALRKDGTIFPAEIQARMLEHKGRTIRVTALRDITNRKEAENSLKLANNLLEQKVKTRTEELERKSHRLGEINTALNVLLKKRDEDKNTLEENVLRNVQNLIQPLIDNLKDSSLNDNQIGYLEALQSFINEIISPFSSTLNAKYKSLTPTEIRIANLVREGKSTKEITQLLNSTIRAVKHHRHSIRFKLGLVKEKANLSTHLSTLQ
jgi:PAS domain S-box-containing protein